ncbi:IscS subfamily cysteine desulfurase [Aliidongia dinghuensis]|uniref:Cysteine desulfurase n=1 Tax=Aliidongia dinghuensis TaxID=1867774 RepID=A0A8J2YQQ0_9PROT|nr:aminotransferase class V-fold PLP-dependent enzyme [Aliidongia dinghuensis]GGF05955.1 IscS subfamily cysteine desulfurase [Aliidongia dinghuensis]
MSGATTPVYLDYPATTPCDPRVVDAMLPFFSATAANPHNRNHAPGRAAAAAIERARAEVAALIAARPAEILFTSGATEANNLALKGVARARAARGRHIVTVATEHASVLEPLEALAREGWSVTVLPVDAGGRVDPDRLARELRPDTVLVSVMAVNNEIGVIQPLGPIGTLCRARGILFHSDAAQAAGRMPLDVDALELDLASVSAHKLYGPPGVGALYVRSATASDLKPLMEGGGQERGLRPGTLPTPLIVGFGQAAALAAAALPTETAEVGRLTQRLWQGLSRAVPGLRRNGDPAHVAPGLLSLTFPGIDATELMEALPELALSSGAACQAESGLPSPVLTALGLDPVAAQATLRLGLGRFTTGAEIDRAVAAIARAAAALA